MQAEANANESVLEKFINIPGLHHLAENIFLNLKYQDLEACRMIKGTFQLFLDQIMENPLFWLEKYIRRGMSKKNQIQWREIIQMTRDTYIGEIILRYLKHNFKLERVVDFNAPCYIRKENLVKYYEIVIKVKNEKNFSNVSYDYYHDEIVKILDPTNNPDDLMEGEMSPIYWAARNGHTEILQVLALLTDNPISPDKDGWTLIHEAALEGHTEIVKFLASLTDNPNARDKDGLTPIDVATQEGHVEIVKFLASLTDNPNAPCNGGFTPIYIAAMNGHTEIVKFLAPLTDNPNAPDRDGKTPSSVTNNAEICRILEFFNTSRKRNAGPSTNPSQKQAKKF